MQSDVNRSSSVVRVSVECQEAERTAVGEGRSEAKPGMFLRPSIQSPNVNDFHVFLSIN